MSSFNNPQLNTLVDLLRWRAKQQKHDRLYTFLANGETEEAHLTYGELDRQARAIAAWFQSRGVGPGERALLLYPPGLDYIAALFGCFYAGIIAVPVYPPRPNRSLARLQSIVSDTKARMALSAPSVLLRIKSLSVQPTDLQKLEWVTPNECLAFDLESTWQEPRFTSNSVAFLQYTSGSTGRSKGVVLTHGNLLANEDVILKTFRLGPACKMVSWLPLYHDMGLIGGVLQPLFGGYSCVLMSPLSFLQRPYRWLAAISHYRGTIAGGPNFCYDFCAQRVTPEQRASLDLSSWTVAFNGAEPVRERTLHHFASSFAPSGFNPRAFHPCYGLAEATLVVSGGKPLKAKPASKPIPQLEGEEVSSIEHSRTAVSCGRIAGKQKVVIVDPLSLTRRDDNSIGEIWVAGPSVALGYWNSPQDTARTFNAYLAETGEGPFLRTGDLGFMRDGQLFVTGRLKDLIIIRGRNHYPPDIELTVESSHPSIRPGCVAAFGIDLAGEERLVVLCEVELRPAPDLAQIISEVRQAVGETHEVDVHAVSLLRPGTISKTSSGKIQRFACRSAFLARTLPVLEEWRERTDLKRFLLGNGSEAVLNSEEAKLTQLEQQLVQIFEEVFATQGINVSDNFFRLGGNSLLATQAISRINDLLRVDLQSDVLFHSPTIAELVRRLEEREGSSENAEFSIIKPVNRNHLLPLSSAQLRMWFLEELMPGNPFYNIALEARFQETLDLQAVEASLFLLLERQEILRASFPIFDGKPICAIASVQPIRLPLVDLSKLPHSAREIELKRLTRNAANHAFDFLRGPLLDVTLLRLDHADYVVLVCVHHIVCDGWGLRVLIEDLNELFSAISRKESACLPPLDIQYGDFSLWQRDAFHSSPAFARQAEYWRTRFRGTFPALDLPLDFHRPQLPRNRGARVTGMIAGQLRSQLAEFCGQQNVTLFTVLLCALKILLHKWTGQSDIIVGTVVANRNRKELEHLVGCFLNFLALRTELSLEVSGLEFLQRVRTTVVEALTNQDYPFERLVDDVNPSRGSGRKPIYNVGLWLHDYVVPQLFEKTLKGRTRLIDTQTSDLDLRVIATETANGSIDLAFEYSPDLFHEETMKELFECYLLTLRTLLENPARRVVDFPFAEKMAHRPAPEQQTEALVIAANFTVEPIGETLSFWMAQFGIQAKIQFAPYNQVFQQLLGSGSLIRTNRNGFNIILLSLERWLKPGEPATVENRHEVEQSVRDLTLSLDAASQQSGVLTLLCTCPPSEKLLRDSKNHQLFEAMLELVEAGTKKIQAVQLVDLGEAVTAYKVKETTDPFLDEVGNIPFTDEFFVAAGTFIARKLLALKTPPFKVLVLDCDQTLWQGVCGEVGPRGIQLTMAFTALQEFVLMQQANGMLLCLCSRNNEEDVLEVFQQHPEMPLKLDHFVAQRINWKEKSENIESLAEELQLSLDAFILLDDDAAACAEVREHLPQVLVVQLPADEGEIPEFLKHVWAFDRIKVTDEDKARVSQYKQSSEREKFRSSSLTLGDFLAGLRLEIEITPMKADQLSRVAQLTQRTSQFNVSVNRRNEAIIEHLLGQPAYECWVVHLNDRFGDYGLVGVVIFSAVRGILKVDDFLLSCRALGRNVEHAMLRKVVELAEDRNCDRLQIHFTQTSKNKPAADFLEHFATERVLPAERGVYLIYSLETIMTTFANAGKLEAAREPSLSRTTESELTAETMRSSVFSKQRTNLLASRLRSTSEITEAMRSNRQTRRQLTTTFVAPRTPVEIELAEIWSEVLRIDPVGVYDNFFDYGGHSLLATQLLSRVRNKFQVEITLLDLFEAPTISALTTLIAQQLTKANEADVSVEILRELEHLSEAEAKALLSGLA